MQFSKNLDFSSIQRLSSTIYKNNFWEGPRGALDSLDIDGAFVIRAEALDLVGNTSNVLPFPETVGELPDGMFSDEVRDTSFQYSTPQMEKILKDELKAHVFGDYDNGTEDFDTQCAPGEVLESIDPTHTNCTPWQTIRDNYIAAYNAKYGNPSSPTSSTANFFARKFSSNSELPEPPVGCWASTQFGVRLNTAIDEANWDTDWIKWRCFKRYSSSGFNSNEIYSPCEFIDLDVNGYSVYGSPTQPDPVNNPYLKRTYVFDNPLWLTAPNADPTSNPDEIAPDDSDSLYVRIQGKCLRDRPGQPRDWADKPPYNETAGGWTWGEGNEPCVKDIDYVTKPLVNSNYIYFRDKANRWTDIDPDTIYKLKKTPSIGILYHNGTANLNDPEERKFDSTTSFDSDAINPDYASNPTAICDSDRQCFQATIDSRSGEYLRYRDAAESGANMNMNPYKKIESASPSYVNYKDIDTELVFPYLSWDIPGSPGTPNPDAIRPRGVWEVFFHDTKSINQYAEDNPNKVWDDVQYMGFAQFASVFFFSNARLPHIVCVQKSSSDEELGEPIDCDKQGNPDCRTCYIRMDGEKYEFKSIEFKYTYLKGKYKSAHNINVGGQFYSYYTNRKFMTSFHTKSGQYIPKDPDGRLNYTPGAGGNPYPFVVCNTEGDAEDVYDRFAECYLPAGDPPYGNDTLAELKSE